VSRQDQNLELQRDAFATAEKYLDPRNAADKVIIYWSDGAETVIAC
jgi:hypothetical protein